MSTFLLKKTCYSFFMGGIKVCMQQYTYPTIYLPDTFQISFCYGIFHHGWWTTFLWPKVSRLLTMLSHHRLDFRTGLKYSFWAPEVPVLRVRKSYFHCFSSLQNTVAIGCHINMNLRHYYSATASTTVTAVLVDFDHLWPSGSTL